MTTQTPANAEIEKVTPDSGPVFHKFLTPDLGPKKNAESCRSRLQHSGSGATSVPDSSKGAVTCDGDKKLAIHLKVITGATFQTQWLNGLLFHMTQPTSRSTTRSRCSKQTNH